MVARLRPAGSHSTLVPGRDQAAAHGGAHLTGMQQPDGSHAFPPARWAVFCHHCAGSAGYQATWDSRLPSSALVPVAGHRDRQRPERPVAEHAELTRDRVWPKCIRADDLAARGVDPHGVGHDREALARPLRSPATGTSAPRYAEREAANATVVPGASPGPAQRLRQPRAGRAVPAAGERRAVTGDEHVDPPAGSAAERGARGRPPGARSPPGWSAWLLPSRSPSGREMSTLRTASRTRRVPPRLCRARRRRGESLPTQVTARVAGPARAVATAHERRVGAAGLASSRSAAPPPWPPSTPSVPCFACGSVVGPGRRPDRELRAVRRTARSRGSRCRPAWPGPAAWSSSARHGNRCP